MKISGAQIVSALRENLSNHSGRHLYGVLAPYAGLARFEQESLSQASLVEGKRFPAAVNLNLGLMERIGDDDLRQLVRSEGKHPTAIQRRLNLEFDALLGSLLEGEHFLILKQIELLFAYSLDLQTIRARATNQNHILLLLPGERRGDHIALFTEANARFQRELPYQLIAENHLWELEDASQS